MKVFPERFTDSQMAQLLLPHLPLPFAHTFALDESAQLLRHRGFILLTNEIFSF